MAGNTNGTVAIVGAVCALIGTVAGHFVTLFVADADQSQKTHAAIAAEVQYFAHALQDASPVFQSNDNGKMTVAFSTLYELAAATQDDKVRLQEKNSLIVLAGTIPRAEFQNNARAIYSTDTEASTILNTTALHAALALLNVHEQSQSVARNGADPSPETTILPHVSIANRTLADVGWVYLGRGTRVSSSELPPIINFYPNISGPTGQVITPGRGSVVTLARSVNFRMDRPSADLRLAPIIGELGSGRRLTVIDAPVAFKYNDLTSAIWAHVTVAPA